MLKALGMAAARINWSRLASRDRMQRQGIEDIKGQATDRRPSAENSP
jgi:hypothetical protein